MEAIFPGSVLGSGPQKHWSLPLDSMKVESTGAVRKKGIPQITGIQTLVTSRNKKRPFCGSSSEQEQISLDLGHLRPESKDNS